MKWTKKDIQKYNSAKEYIDTIIFPLAPFQLYKDEEIEKTAYQSEYLTIFSQELEKRLTGRTMLLPTYHYLKNTDSMKELERINEWITHIKLQPFTKIFYFTFDASWKKVEKDLNGELIWLPFVQSMEIQSPEFKAIVQEQLEQITDLIRTFW